jgi:hypothetical protein
MRRKKHPKPKPNFYAQEDLSHPSTHKKVGGKGGEVTPLLNSLLNSKTTKEKQKKQKAPGR